MNAILNCNPSATPGAERDAAEYPASFAQQRLWVAHRLSSNPAIFNGGDAFRITGTLSIPALESALRGVLRRHEILRTRFLFNNDALVQQVQPVPAQVLATVRLHACEPALVAKCLDRLVARPFSLERLPLFRCVLLELSATEYIFVFVAHHIICDGLSFEILTNELEILYAAALGVNRFPLSPLDLQYGDYARGEHAAAAIEGASPSRRYWREKLAGAPERIEIGAAPAERVVQEQCFAISGVQAARIRAFARRQRVTPFMLFQAVWSVLLFRYTGQEDMVCTSPIAGRNSPELLPLIGVFINLLPLRLQPVGDLPFAAFLASVKRTCLEAYAHQQVPFQHMVESHAGAHTKHARFLQILFGYQHHEEKQFSLLNLRTERIKVPAAGLEADLALSVREEAAGWNWNLLAVRGILRQPLWGRLPHHFIRLLNAVLDAPHLRLFELPLLSDEEVAELSHFSGHDALPPCAFVHHSFERQASMRGDAIALEHRGLRLTYRELNARANVLANRLKSLGARPDTAVGVLIDRSLDMVVSVLGVLKAGAAYVPLDPAQPAERLEYMLERASARILVTQTAHVAKLASYSGEVLVIERVHQQQFSDFSNPHAPIAGENLAYVIFTSGSTGRPKGVMVTHSNFASFFAAMNHLAVITATDHLLAVTTLCFDIASVELLLPLTLGARVAICDRDSACDPSLLARALEQSGATALQATPATWQGLVDSSWLGHHTKILCGGDALPGSLAAALCARSPHVWNLYGPTETTVWSSAGLIQPGAPVHIGRPLANTRWQILDAWSNLLPAGAVGELCISGQGVARGYIGKPDLTAERFLPAPGGQRYYRTGDLARYRENGVVQVLGRIDHQVKIRGFRVELGEIEACLAAHDAISAVVVSSSRDSDGDQRLVAYLVAKEDPVPSSHDLRAFLLEKLPEYMVPSHFVFLASIPLTANGKVDRAKLPSPADTPFASGTGPTEPRSETEEFVAGMMAQMLGLAAVDTNADFFTLGGTSISAARLLARIRDTLRVDISLRDFFDSPSVFHLARKIESELAHSRQLPVAAIERHTEDGPPPLSFAQQRLWVLHQLNPTSDAYVLYAALKLTGKLDISRLNGAISQTIARHEPLRTRFAEERPVQIVDAPVNFRIPIVDLAAVGSVESATARFRQHLVSRGFDLSKEWPWRIALLRLLPESYILALAIHHIAFDDASIERFIEEMETLYNNWVSGAARIAAELPIRYQDYARWQRKYLVEATLERSLEYWSKKLEGLPVLDLPSPVWCARSTQGDPPGDVLRFTPEVSSQFRSFSRRYRSTIFMTMLAGIQVVLARCSRQEQFGIGVPVSGRELPAIARLIGVFVNTLVIRTDLSGDPTFAEALRRVRTTMLEALAHQELPFEKLAASVRVAQQPGDQPLFRVLVVEQRRRRTPALSGLQAEWIAAGESEAKVDLEFTITDTGAAIEVALRCRHAFGSALDTRLLQYLKHFLTQALANPAARVWQVGIPEPEARQLTCSFNATNLVYAQPIWVHRQFEQRAARCPLDVALRFDSAAISYGELNARANSIAHRLAQAGVVRGDIVGIMAERSVEMVVGLLGILKAGAAYLPLDPRYPSQRISYMLAQAPIHVVLTAGIDTDAAARLGLCVIGVPAEAPSSAEESTHDPAVELTSSDLAYVIFTSGSTGRPKGVMISHGALHNRLQWMQNRYQLAPADSVLQKTPFTFDVSVWEFFWPLMAGATVVIARPGGHKDPAYLRRCMQENRVTTVHFVPSMLRAFLADSTELPPTLRRVFASGEELLRDLTDAFIARCPAELHNLYGPTEAAVDVSAWNCREVSLSARVPIGFPIANTQLHVLDRWLNVMPPGLPGELFIGGVGLARGYLSRADLTAEKFTPNPFGERPGERLYRTGDLARFLDDGSIEFLGRLDDQVKIRGFRIEPGEVSAALMKHASVREAATLAQPGPDAQMRLIAYVSTTSEVSAVDLRNHLEGSLPDFMVPAGFVFLETLPRNTSGKLDRKALPKYEWGDSTPAASDLPATAVEQMLAEIWSQALNRNQVGRRDNFFDLGGDSIVSLQVVRRAACLGFRIAPADIFSHPTVAELAPYLASVQPSGFSQTSPDSAPLTPVQEQFLASAPADPHHFNQALMFELVQPFTPEGVQRAVLATIARHSALGLRFACSGNKWSQRVANDFSRGVFSRIDLSGLPDWRRTSSQFAARIQGTLNIVHGPVCRVVLFEAGLRQPARLLLLAHHLAVDGVSWRILIDDLQQALRQLPNQAPSRLAWGTPYTRWALQLHSYASSGELDGELAFWLEQASESGFLPRDNTGPNLLASSRSITVSVDVSPLVPSSDPTATLQELQIAALLIALQRWTGRTRLRIDLEAHGREYFVPDADISQTVGWFTSIYPLAFDLGTATPTIANTLQVVRERLQRVPHGGVGYGVLRHHRAASRSLQQLPGADLCFNYLGQIEGALDANGPLRLLHEPLENLESPRNVRQYPIQVNTILRGRRIDAVWTYSQDVFSTGAIKQLATDFARSLECSLKHTKTAGMENALPDQPQVGLSEYEMKHLMAELQSG